jgi:hypothetical protein
MDIPVLLVLQAIPEPLGIREQQDTPEPMDIPEQQDIPEP